MLMILILDLIYISPFLCINLLFSLFCFCSPLSFICKLHKVITDILTDKRFNIQKQYVLTKHSLLCKGITSIPSRSNFLLIVTLRYLIEETNHCHQIGNSYAAYCMSLISLKHFNSIIYCAVTQRKCKEVQSTENAVCRKAKQ